MYPMDWGEVFIERFSARAKIIFTSQQMSTYKNYAYIKYVINDQIESIWERYITDADLTISISPTTNFDLLDQNGHGWLNTFKATAHGIGSPGEIRTGEGLFENIVYSSNIQLQRWTVNGYGIMVRQKTGSSWQAWKGIPYV